jgi:hypothetical protein
MIIYILVIVVLLYPAVYGTRHFLIQKQRSQTEKQLMETYAEQMVKHKLSVEYVDRIGNRIVALDRKNKKLLVVDQNVQEGEKEVCLPLLTVGDTKIIHKKNSDGGIRKILVELKNKRVGNRMHICFFDERTDRLKDLPSFARKAFFWKSRIDVNKYPGHVYPGHEFVL